MSVISQEEFEKQMDDIKNLRDDSKIIAFNKKYREGDVDDKYKHFDPATTRFAIAMLGIYGAYKLYKITRK